MAIEAKGLLPIGRFARATGLTVKALRHYAEARGAAAAWVDESTRYRYYAVAQIRTAAVIARLRALEVPLSEVAALVEVDEATLRERLAAHRARLAARLQETRQVLDELDRVIEGEEEPSGDNAPGGVVEEVPARTYVIARDRVPMEELTQVIPRRIAETHDWVVGHGGPVEAPMALVTPADEEGLVDLDVGWPVATRLDPHAARRGHVRPDPRRRPPPRRAIRAAPRDVRRARAGDRSGGTETDRSRWSRPMTNPEEEPDPEKWVTEIIWPIE